MSLCELLAGLITKIGLLFINILSPYTTLPRSPPRRVSFMECIYYILVTPPSYEVVT